MPVLEQVLERYPNQVKVVFKQFPLRRHAFADKAARASLAAHKMGRFWPFHDLLFNHYNRINDQKIEDIRSALGLEAQQFRQLMAAEETRRHVAADLRNGRDAGVRGTPTVFVNGKMLRNSSLRELQRAIEAALGN